MKRSETHGQYVKEDFVTGVVFLLIGILWLLATTIISVAGVEMKVSWSLASAPSLIFFGASAWSFFVEYPFDKDIQLGVEKEEAMEEAEKQRQLSISSSEEKTMN